MAFSFTKLAGLPAERLLSVVEPVLTAHGLEGVELVWKTDNRGWVLYLTVERPGTSQTGAGVTLDDCSELSRDLSAALDVEDLVPGAYRLEVGTPGIERRLYTVGDFQRFAGQTVKVKLQKPLDGEYTLRGELRGVNEAGQVMMVRQLPGKANAETPEPVSLDLDNVQTAHLVLEWGPEPRPTSKKTSGSKKPTGSNKPTGSKKPKPASNADNN